MREPRNPDLRFVHERGARRRAAPPPRAALTRAESGVWRLEELGLRARASARTARARSLRSLLAWAATLVLLGGVVALSALTLVEITERLVELGGGPVRPSPSD